MFTKEQIDEIAKRLENRGVKDTYFPTAILPLQGNELLPLIQSGENKNVSIDDFWEELSKYLNEGGIYSTFIEKCEAILNDIQNMIDGIESSGIAVSNEFGDNPHISISQKTLTSAINKIWQKIEDITGESLQGIRMTVTPSYFISEDGCTVHITANTVESDNIFEHIAFYINGTLITEADNVGHFEDDIELTETSVIKCVAKIMGIEYTEQKVVTHYSSFWLGAGATYVDVMTTDNLRPIENGMKGNYDVECEQGDYLFVIVAKSLSKGYIRIDMNGFEVPTERAEVTLGEDEYYVFKSKNAYQASTYNIDTNS